MADDEGPNEAAQAFEELRAEVTLMRRAVERLTAEREQAIADALGVSRQAVHQKYNRRERTR